MLRCFKLASGAIDGGRPRRFFTTGAELLLLALVLLPPAVVISGGVCSTYRSWAEDEELAEESAGEWGDEVWAVELPVPPPPPAVTVETMSPLPLTIVTVCEEDGLMRLTRITGTVGVLSEVHFASLATSLKGDEVALSETDAELAGTGVAGAEVVVAVEAGVEGVEIGDGRSTEAGSEN